MNDSPETQPIGRGDFVRRASAAAVAATAAAAAAPAPGMAASPPVRPGMDGAQALQALLDGNTRYAQGRPICGPLTARRAELVSGQSPFALVLGCSDSRVPIETIFDQEPGSIFVVRVAGNTADAIGIGSLEYAITNFKSPVLLVLGHASCGAVHAGVAFVQGGPAAPGHIQDVVAAVVPAVKEAEGRPGDWADNAAMQNVRDTLAGIVAASKIASDAIASGALAVHGGFYDLSSGKVTVLS